MDLLGEIIAEGGIARLEEFKRRQQAEPETISIGRFCGNAPDGIGGTLSAMGGRRKGTELYDPILGPVTRLFLIRMAKPPTRNEFFGKH